MAKSPSSRTSLKILGDKACPACRDKGRDSKGNHLIIFEGENGEIFGKCNKPYCGHYEPPGADFTANPRREKTPEEIAEEMGEIATYPIRALDSRGISLSVAERFGIRAGLSERDGETVTQHYYPRSKEGEVVAYNVRNLDPKSFWGKGDRRGRCEPFGWGQVNRGDTGRKRLFIAEDELSAASIFQVLEARTSEKYRHIKPAVLGWSAGVGTDVKDIGWMLESGFLKQFSEIVYVHDNDDAGVESAERVRAILPQCKFVTTPLKDANDMLMAKRGDELFNLLVYQSKTKSPSSAIRARDALEQALTPPKWGLSYPWQGLTNITYGQREGECRAWGGGVGNGKTAVGHEILAWNMIEHNLPSAAILLEENEGDSLKNIVGKIASVPFHRPDIPFDKTLFLQNYHRIENLLYLWRNQGQNDFDAVLEAIRYWAVVEKVKYFCLDNITCLVSHLELTQQNTEIARIARSLTGIADELGLMIDVFSHLNPPGGNKSHETGAEVKEVQFTGSRAISRFFQFMFGFERNKQAEGDDKHNSRIRTLKNRPYGVTGIIYTRYDPATGRLLETDSDGVREDDNDEPF